MKIGLSAHGAVVAAAVFCLLALPLSAQESTSTLKNETQNAAGNGVSKTIEITATNYKFDPSEFTVPVGTRVKVVLINKGRAAHNIQFDLPGDRKLKLPADLKSGESGSLEFVAPGPGTYSYICPVDMHHTLGMKGKMITRQESL